MDWWNSGGDVPMPLGIQDGMECCSFAGNFTLRKVPRNLSLCGRTVSAIQMKMIVIEKQSWYIRGEYNKSLEKYMDNILLFLGGS